MTNKRGQTMNIENIQERFLRYVCLNTSSDEKSDKTPSTSRQFELADMLVDEFRKINIEAQRDENCYVYAHIPATKGFENAPSIGFIAHMDTVLDFTDKEIKPIVHEKYDGADIELKDGGITLSNKDFPHLSSLTYRTLITSDGNTILGADDKAGIAEIMTMAETIINENVTHGRIAIAFTPDEEIGRGADNFDIEKFGADFAYTVDGGAEGEIEYENFNAASARVVFRGVNVHPGDAKNIMINAADAATEFNMMLPKEEKPRYTSGYEGFYHLTGMSGDVSFAELEYIIRDFDRENLRSRLEKMFEIEALLNKKYSADTVKVETKLQYENMAEIIEKHSHLIINAKMAAIRANVTPVVKPIRGGTDGARLSYMGLPCPNLGTGGYAYHGPFEHITVEGMKKTVDLLINLVKIYSGNEDMDCSR